MRENRAIQDGGSALDQPNPAARRRLLSRRREPLFVADWERVLMIHFEVDPDALQREVPFPLDLWEGRAFVSLVAFTMRGMRPAFGGRMARAFFHLIGTHEFLNARTYVRHRGESGIYFLTEWLSNPLSVRLGPMTFGLPYKFARLNYVHPHEQSAIRGNATTKVGRFAYAAELEPRSHFAACAAGSPDEFLMERYTAFTARNDQRRFFRVWHEPWPQVPVHARVIDKSLLTATWPWFAQARLMGANYSPGVRDVQMGWPHHIGRRQRHRALSHFFEMP